MPISNVGPWPVLAKGTAGRGLTSDTLDCSLLWLQIATLGDLGGAAIALGNPRPHSPADFRPVRPVLSELPDRMSVLFSGQCGTRPAGSYVMTSKNVTPSGATAKPTLRSTFHNPNAKKEPDDWVSGDDPMTGAQISHLKNPVGTVRRAGAAVFDRTSLRPKRPNGSTRLRLSEDQVQQR